MSQTPNVTDNLAAKRYEARLDGDLAGTAEYIRTREVIAFVYTTDLRAGERRRRAGDRLVAAVPAAVGHALPAAPVERDAHGELPGRKAAVQVVADGVVGGELRAVRGAGGVSYSGAWKLVGPLASNAPCKSQLMTLPRPRTFATLGTSRLPISVGPPRDAAETVRTAADVPRGVGHKSPAGIRFPHNPVRVSLPIVLPDSWSR